MNNQTADQRSADNIRALSIAMVEQAKSGHPGGPMGGADFMHILYSEFLQFDPSDSNWMWRDRFFLDPGHLSAMLYSQLYLLGKYTKKEVSQFRQWDSPTPGHPEVDKNRGIENTSGPLGQGHAMGVGAALAGKFLQAKFGDWTDHTIYAYISDGGIQEEISQGVGRIAGYLGLSNLVMFFDSNDVQLSTYTDEVTSEDTQKKYEAWGWHVLQIDGHNHGEIRKAIQAGLAEKAKPTLIIGKTVMGKGCVDEHGNSYEGYTELHGKPIGNTGADYAKTLENLGANVDSPFDIYEDVKLYYDQLLVRKSQEVIQRKSKESAWRKENPQDAEKLDLFISGDIPEIDFSSIQTKENAATRDASASVLAYLAEHVENLIVASADLANSDKTDGFLRQSKAFCPGEFDANFLHAGVAEFSMAAMANGMALHGGVIPAVGTFFIFSDYQKPAIRLSSLMELPVIYLWTHDAFRVGEDGPTHQPIEQEAQIRLMEKVKNHSGKAGFIALRPADRQETVVAWEMALKMKDRPVGLIFSRQGIKDLSSDDAAYTAALQAQQGGYLVQADEEADITLIANGSEVSTLIGAADLLREEGVKVNIASVMSEALFKEQSDDYQSAILSTPLRFALSAGLPETHAGLAGAQGVSEGLSHFGYSAPASVLDEKFGFTPEQAYHKIKAYLQNHK